MPKIEYDPSMDVMIEELARIDMTPDAVDTSKVHLVAAIRKYGDAEEKLALYKEFAKNKRTDSKIGRLPLPIARELIEALYDKLFDN